MIKLNLGCGGFPLEGFVNLDKAMGWTFESGIPYADGEVDGITISHALMYLLPEHRPAFFAEVARVLAPEGVLRITEDDSINPLSSRVGGWSGRFPATAMTSYQLLARCCWKAELLPTLREADTGRADLRQAGHGTTPDVFFMEATHRQPVLLSPHNDDETLFAAYTIIRLRPHVVVCHGSAGDYGDSEVRERESITACKILGARSMEQWLCPGASSLEAAMYDLDSQLFPSEVWAPSPKASHPEHVNVAIVARSVFGDRVRNYHTYDVEKVREGIQVLPQPGWEELKRKALACYQTQIHHPRAGKFFQDDLREYRC